MSQRNLSRAAIDYLTEQARLQESSLVWMRKALSDDLINIEARRKSIASYEATLEVIRGLLNG